MLNVVVRHCGIGVGDHQVVWLGSWPPVARRWDFEFQPSMSWCDIQGEHRCPAGLFWVGWGFAGRVVDRRDLVTMGLACQRGL